MAFEKELAFMKEIATLAGEVGLRHQKAGFSAETKPDNTPVTIADRESEALICAAIVEAFPEDGILGEEGTGKEAQSDRHWIVDPIDGTKDFVRGNKHWAVLIGLEMDGESMAGVCHFPALGDTYHAARGDGAFRNGEQIKASGIQSLKDAVICPSAINRNHKGRYGDPQRLLEFLSQFWAIRTLGGAPDAMMVASGQADIWIEPKSEAWDLAATKVILEESGAVFVNFDGGSSLFGGNAIACAPGVAQQVHEFFLKVPV
jgi:histidinol-phosphatase